jgi:divalent metal cation (Fe/Co/Zn/Cd) transporter
VDEATVVRLVLDETGRPPREVRFLQTDEGLFAFLTLSVEPGATLAEAHARASRVEERIRRACPRIAELIVHTEP